jgi:hypothetical protein
MKRLSTLLLPLAVGATLFVSACGQTDSEESATLNSKKRYSLSCVMNVVRKSDNRATTYEFTGKKTYRQDTPTMIDIAGKDRKEFQNVATEVRNRCTADYLNINTAVCRLDPNRPEDLPVLAGLPGQTQAKGVDLDQFRGTYYCFMREAR